MSKPMKVFGFNCTLTGNILQIDEFTLFITNEERRLAGQNFFKFCDSKIDELIEKGEFDDTF